MDDGLLIGGKYRLKKLIGAGGMGQVWIGRNEVTEREFAIKLLLPQAATNAQVVTRFVQEAKVSGRLRHPGILEIYDVGTAPELNGAPFLVMELLHGVTLEAAIKSLEGLPLRFSLLVAIAVARALRAAHEKGVIHRDLKPANVLLHRDESGAVIPKLLDFGISKLAASDGDSDAMGLTQTGALLGSPRFMSPEQIASQKDIDGRSDLHALGVLVWWCLLAKSPFDASGFHNLMLEILADQRPRLLDAMPGVPPGVSDFVGRAFATRREQRFGSATEALQVLEAELAKLGPGPTLETRAWVDEVLARVVASPAPSPVLPQALPAEGKETTTHGAVSVSVERGVDAVSSSPVGSPAAYTMDGASTGRPMPLGETTSRRSKGMFAVAVASLVAVVAIVGGVLAYSRPDTHVDVRQDPAASNAAAAMMSVVVRPAVSLAPPPVDPAPAEADAGATPVAATAATHPVPRLPPPAFHPPAKGTASKPSDDPFHGVTGTGL